MDGAAVKELADRFRGPMTLDTGDIAIPKDWQVIDPASVPRPSPEELKVYSLGAVRDYLKSNRDAVDLDLSVVHVVSPQVVRVLGPLNHETRAREAYVEATAANMMDGFVGKYVSVEEFVIGLQARFVDIGDRAKVLALVGNLRHEVLKTSVDDGVTQTVSVSAGVVRKSEVDVPNPVTLYPWRTFREVSPQPGSPFVLRIQNNRGFFEVGLFEADGGSWRLSAIDKVRDWLRIEIPESVAVLA